MYDNLIAELARHHIAKKQVWQLLDITATTLRSKFSRKGTDFYISEIQLIYDTFFIDDERVKLIDLIKYEKTAP